MYKRRDGKYFTIIRVQGKNVPEMAGSYYYPGGIVIRINLYGEIFYENLRDIVSRGQILINRNFNLGRYRILTENVNYLLINVKKEFIEELTGIDLEGNFARKFPWFLSREYLKVMENFEALETVDLIVMKMLGEIFLELAKGERIFQENEDLKLLREIENYVMENIDCDISVQQIERKFSLNKNSVVKVFLDNFNMYPSEYILNKKLEEAARRLLVTEDKVVDIAMDLKFSSPSFLAKSFKDKYSITPLAFRRRKI
ncbi:helix-turn-helix transcriptional regulator [Cetobacterium sp. SF1]|uniref:helix-turn-helix transcriptional regulator n=1 Tax=Cetobacterium sp. SF1 TaxID=3417654 RepID=UPI003CE6E62A